MASSHASSDPSPQPTTEPDEPDIMIPREPASPPSEGTEDEDILYGDGDDAQSFIQPAMSPVATRVSSSKVLAAERAAARQTLQGEASPDGIDLQQPLDPRHINTESISKLQTKKPARGRDGVSPGPPVLKPPHRSQTVVARLPSPWQSGPKDFVVNDFKVGKPALTGVIHRSTRHQRASSIGDSALRRLSKAFDSVNLPNFSASSLFSSSHKDDNPAASPTAIAHSRAVQPKSSLGRSPPHASPISPGQASDTSKDSLALQRTVSDDSALYHSLSRVSSYGDDDRWTHIREQVNVRMKAIRDSWDAPTFKLPSMCNEALNHKSNVLTIFYRHNSRVTKDRAVSQQFLDSR